jgi:photosystem II stability/assembly factor-like uncharacterized protein
MLWTRPRRLSSCLLVVISIALFAQHRPAAARPEHANVPRTVPQFGALAPAFIRNSGQTDASARFFAVGGGRPIFFTPGDVRIVDPARQSSLWLTFVGGRAASLEGESKTGGSVTYMKRGRDAERLFAYRDVLYRRVWPGIDARVSGMVSGLEYSFEIAPHADPRLIHLRYQGADRVTLTRTGELTLDAGGTTIVDRAPVAYQRTNGRTQPVEVRFVLYGDDLTFALGPYDRTLPLVIDPTLVYSTYLGSSGSDGASAIAVDSTGAAYVTGATRYSDFPTTPGAYQTTYGGGTGPGGSDAFVAKINAAGTHFDYVTYLGGSSTDFGLGIAVDGGGNAYVTGTTVSNDFPTTPGSTAKRPGNDGFLTKLNSNGSGLVFSTFFGIGFDARVAGVALDGAGNAYVTGTTQSINVPVTSGGQTFSGSNNDNAFLLKVNPTGQVIYGTYLGGMSSDVATGVAVDGAGHAYVVGNTFLSRDGIAMSRSGTPVQRDPNSAIFKSTDGAQTFVPANHGLDSSIAMAVAIDPQQPDTIYQATSDGGMFKSTDGGDSWFPINSGFGILPSGAWDIAVNPNTPSTLLAIAYSQSTNGILSVFRSLDAGANWTKVLQGARTIAIAPSDPSMAYVAGGPSGVARSTDGGATWTQVLSGAQSLAVDPTNASVVYAGQGNGQVLKSSTAGNSWTGVTVDPGGSAITIVCLAVDPTSPNTVWAGTNFGNVFKSSDGGTTWAVQPPAGQPLAGPSVMTFDGGTLYIGYTSSSSSGTFSIAKTSDKGVSWTHLTVRGNQMPVRGIAARNGVVFLATQAFSDGFLFKVDTNATSNSIMWGTYVGGSLDDAAVGVAVDPAGNPVVAIRTASHDFPNTAATDYRPSAVARVSSDGSSYTVSSYAGPAAAGPGSLGIVGIAVDTNGVAYITGQQNDSGSDKSIFVDRVEPTGATTAEYVLNGSHSNVGSIADTPGGIAVDNAGGVYVTGSTPTIDFPTTPNAPQPFYASGASDAFISKVSFSDVTPPPPPTNIALNKAVVVSSVFSPQYAGAYAVDGNPTTRWSSAFSDPQWIYVDLGQTYAISEVILRWETAFGADYQVQVSNDASSWTTIRTITNGDGNVDDLTGLSGTGRYVRIYGTRRATEWGYSLWEFEVYGTPAAPPPPTDIALNKPVVVSSEFSSQYAGSFAVDGDGSTRWSSAFSDPQWIYVDLGQRYAVTRVKLSWEAAYGADFEIQVSDDASFWTTIFTAVNNQELTNDFGGLGVGRYVRMHGARRGTPWGYSLWSFEVYGDPAPPSADRALNRPAASSSDFSPAYAAANAVDGDASTRWSSQFSDPQWIAVDLGQRFAINEVKLTWETAYGADFEIQVSDDTTHWTPIASLANNNAAVNDLAITGTGRYVRMYGTRRGTEWGYSLWSFEVYGNPTP